MNSIGKINSFTQPILYLCTKVYRWFRRNNPLLKNVIFKCCFTVLESECIEMIGSDIYCFAVSQDLADRMIVYLKGQWNGAKLTLMRNALRKAYHLHIILCSCIFLLSPTFFTQCFTFPHTSCINWKLCLIDR